MESTSLQRNHPSESHDSAVLFVLLSLTAAAALYGIIRLTRRKGERQISIDDLRRAYSGLDPEEME